MATQNALEAQETAVWLAGGTGSISVGVLQCVPLNVYTLPALSMATQKLLVVHDTESGEPSYLLITVGLLHCDPFTVYMVPASFFASPSSATAQNPLVGHETAASISDEPIGVSALQVVAPAGERAAAADAAPLSDPAQIPAASASATLVAEKRETAELGRSGIWAVIPPRSCSATVTPRPGARGIA